MAQLKWRDAIEKILTEAGQAVHYKEITEAIANQGLRKSLGATPANTVFAILSSSIKDEGDSSPFLKTNSGMFMMKSTASAPSPSETAINSETKPNTQIVKCSGVYWNYEKVRWTSKPKILGQQQAGSKAIDFSNQVGVYLLHDRSKVIYVGRTDRRPMGIRLYEHTKDRLNGRWDRFSWFGLRGVDDSGHLTDDRFPPNEAAIIAMMEAVLIEALEPPQNRRAGDGFSDIEYLQLEDPSHEAQKKRQILASMANSL